MAIGPINTSINDLPLVTLQVDDSKKRKLATIFEQSLVSKKQNVEDDEIIYLKKIFGFNFYYIARKKFSSEMNFVKKFF